MRKKAPSIHTGSIELDTIAGQHLGFTKEDFERGSYLWRSGKEIFVSFIVTTRPGTGQFSRLIRRIRELDYIPVVPTPLGKMEAILRRWGWKCTEAYTDFGPCEEWRPPEATTFGDLHDA